MKIADARRLYVRAFAVIRLHDLREELSTDADQREFELAVLNHAEKMLMNMARRLGLTRAITYDDLREDARKILLETHRFGLAALVGKQ